LHPVSDPNSIADNPKLNYGSCKFNHKLNREPRTMLQKLTPAANALKPKITSNKDIALAAPGRWLVEGETGLYLYVSPDGQVRRWIFRYTSPVTHKPTETGLDMASAVSLSQAKSKAQGMRTQIANGICPIHAKRAKRASQVTFKEAADGWIETHRPSWKPGWGGKDGSQLKNAKLVLFHHGAPLANKPVADITPDMIQGALEQLWARAPYQGRRTLRMWSRVLDCAKAKGMRQGDNPADWKGNMEYRFARLRAKDGRHHPALPYEDLPAFIRELRQRQIRGISATCLEFTILTCARTSEVLGMQWSEVDWEKRTWTAPKERMKAGKEHVVPLSNGATEILKRQRELANDSGFVFSGYNREQLAERSLRSVLRYMKMSYTVHGFRSTFRDWAGDTTHFAREHVEECLAHAVGNGVERAYRRQSALEKRRDIMEAWAEFCGSI
jgi:integrase